MRRAFSHPLSDSAATAAARTEDEPLAEPTPFALFVASCQLADEEVRDFLAFVKECGGGAYTDRETLAHLYDIRTVLADDDTLPDDDRRALRVMARIWGREVVTGVLRDG